MGLILGVKNKLRNAWAYFGGGGLILGGRGGGLQYNKIKRKILETQLIRKHQPSLNIHVKYFYALSY